MGDFTDFMSSPQGLGLLSAAAGYAANARRNTPLNNIGAAGLAGLLGYSQAAQAQEAIKRNEMQRQIQDMQVLEMKRKQDAIQNLKSALSPDMAKLVDVAPEIAIKSMVKEPVKPELITVQTPQGPVQRWVKPGESEGVDVGAPMNKEAALPWYVNKDQTGKISIDPAYADFEKAKASAGAAKQSTPYFQFLPSENGYLVGDARSGNISPGLVGGKAIMKGTDSPTLQGQIAGAKESAQTKAGAIAKREVNMTGLGDLVDRAETILSDKTNAPTHSGIGTAVDKAASIVGVAPKGSAQADELRVIGGSLVSKMPRMEGPQSDKDVALYRESAGNVADSTLPLERRLAALKTVKALNAKYEKQGNQESGVRRYNPATGRIE